MKGFANREMAIGGAIVLLFVLIACAAPLLSPYDPLQANFLTIRKPPTWAHPFGTDEVGRDVLARIIYGARSSLLAGIVSVGIAVMIVTHDIAAARLLAHRLLVMRRGQVVEQGLTDRVLDDPQHPYTQLLVSSVLAA